MIEVLFSQYKDYSTFFIFLESIATLFGLISVIFAMRNNILVYPTGIISTGIYVYLLFHWNLFGDLIINFYYTIMSLYGWVLWAKKKDNQSSYPISQINKKDLQTSISIFFFTILFVIVVYIFFNKFTNWYAYTDTLTTGIFFTAMWLMAKRKIESWSLWIIGDIISVPLYFCKGYTISSLQYLAFTILAIFAYKEWKTFLAQKT